MKHQVIFHQHEGRILQVTFTYYPGYAQTMEDPAEDEEIDIIKVMHGKVEIEVNAELEAELKDAAFESIYEVDEIEY